MTVHMNSKKVPALSAHCRFDDHIRCVAAKKNLSHKRESLRLAKMTKISEMLDIPTESTGHSSHSGALHYPKLTIVGNKSSQHSPVVGSRDRVTSSEHVMTSPLSKEESIQFANKNDDGSVMLPYIKDVEMNQLGFTVMSPKSPEQQHLNMLLRSSSFSHEEHHLDQQQHNDNFDQRQLSIDHQPSDNNTDQVTSLTKDQTPNVTTQPHSS